MAGQYEFIRFENEDGRRYAVFADGSREDRGPVIEASSGGSASGLPDPSGFRGYFLQVSPQTGEPTWAVAVEPFRTVTNARRFLAFFGVTSASPLSDLGWAVGGVFGVNGQDFTIAEAGSPADPTHIPVDGTIQDFITAISTAQPNLSVAFNGPGLDFVQTDGTDLTFSGSIAETGNFAGTISPDQIVAPASVSTIWDDRYSRPFPQTLALIEGSIAQLQGAALPDVYSGNIGDVLGIVDDGNGGKRLGWVPQGA